MCTSSTTSLCQSIPGQRDSTTSSSLASTTPPLPPVVAQPKQFGEITEILGTVEKSPAIFQSSLYREIC
jgi:hypothetical protein